MEREQTAERRRRRVPKRRPGRRGAVAAQVAMGLTTMCGFAALTVDVGMMYRGRTELQRTVDAAALAAAAELTDYSKGNPQANARTVAADFALRNRVLGEEVTLEPDQDVIFGRAYINPATNRYVFEETDVFPNAIRVRASQPAPLYFANIFGMASTTLSAKATAVLVPRDIAVVLDLSASHNDDSELRHYKITDINLRDIWTALPNNNDVSPMTDALGFTSAVAVSDNGDGTSTLSIDLTSDDSSKTSALSHVVFGLPQEAWQAAVDSATTSGTYADPVSGTDPTTGVAGVKFDAVGTGLGEDGAVETHNFSFTIPTASLDAMTMVVATKAGTDTGEASYELSPGPTFGFMDTWGTTDLSSSYNPAIDPGLLRLPYNSSWTSSSIQSRLYALGYCYSEVRALMSAQYDSSGSWYGRVAVTLGLARWRSGHPGGLWTKTGETPGNNNNAVGYETEMTWLVDYPYQGSSWRDYFNYMKTSTWMSGTNSAFVSRFGIKTFVNFLLEQVPESFNTPELADTPHQPMKAVKDASSRLITVVEELESDDQVAITSYGTYGYGPADKPDLMSWLSNDFNGLRGKVEALQAGHWTRNTNIAQGIDKGRAVLFDTDNGARNEAAKVMILLTDGIANSTRATGTVNEAVAREDTKAAARDARAQGIQIYTVSVGVAADKSLMAEVAGIGDGEWFHAEGDISEYSAQLEAIFQNLGGKRPVILIQ
ncbi:MAG: VWA domain-containing protein [Phycisphaerae bacterium]|nr:VWA domain-containing protein [Phycisphaerae bacterium]